MGKNCVYSICMCLTTSTYNGVIVALNANIWFVNTSTVAVFVAAALRGTVISHKSKVTLTHSWRHACPVHTPLCAHWLTLTRNTVQEKNKKMRFGLTCAVHLKSNTVLFIISFMCSETEAYMLTLDFTC